MSVSALALCLTSVIAGSDVEPSLLSNMVSSADAIEDNPSSLSFLLSLWSWPATAPLFDNRSSEEWSHRPVIGGACCLAGGACLP